MKEFRSSRPTLFASAVLATVAALSACGGESKANGGDRLTEESVAVQTTNSGVDIVPGSVIPTAEDVLPIVEPTVGLSEVSMTLEEIPEAIEELKSLIDGGFAGKTIKVSQVSDNSYTKPDMVKVYIDECKKNGEPFVNPDGTQAGPEHPNYWSSVLAYCERAGTAMGELYKATGDDKFLIANQKMRALHYAKFRYVQSVDSRVDESYWKVIVPRVYSTSLGK